MKRRGSPPRRRASPSWMLVIAASSDIREATGIDQLILSVKNNSIRAVRDTTKLLDPASVEAAARQILNARSVRIFGVGASALVGEDLYNKLLRIDKNVCFCRDLHIQLTYAANMTPQDVAVLISMSGNTKEVLEMLALSRQCGTPTVALTKFDKSVLAQNADIRLYISAPEATPRSGAMSSRIAQMVAVDVLFTAVAHLDYDRAAASLEKSRESCRPHRVDGAPPLRERVGVPPPAPPPVLRTPPSAALNLRRDSLGLSRRFLLLQPAHKRIGLYAVRPR